VFNGWGRDLVRHGDVGPAIAALKDLATELPADDFEWLFVRAMSRWQQGEPEPALRDYAEAAAWVGEWRRDPQVYATQAGVEQVLGIDASRRRELAVEFLNERLAGSIPSAGLFRQRAALFLGDQDERALVDLQRAMEIDRSARTEVRLIQVLLRLCALSPTPPIPVADFLSLAQRAVYVDRTSFYLCLR
jgi:hypothetical protein